MITYKLSPNLRIKSKEVEAVLEEGNEKLFRSMERTKIIKVLSNVVKLPDI